MTKSTITRTWIGGLVVFAGGILMSIVGVFLLLAYGGNFTQVAGTNNYDFNPDLNGAFWAAVTVIVVGGVIALIGSVVQLVAWIGALFASYLLPEKTWFLVLLLGGLLSVAFAPVGFAAMVAYVVAAPEGVSAAAPSQPAAPAPRTLSPIT